MNTFRTSHMAMGLLNPSISVSTDRHPYQHLNTLTPSQN